ncbi:MAG: outer membrane beta-barrel protein [Crocinitomicaceae bacterium]|nr:outer membrane beta-barrel protein [Crocinitomicaceae bacterium]MBK8925548.1 outer membrane beta-barrel protein [Crocinitomicaceae bacterium]
MKKSCNILILVLLSIQANSQRNGRNYPYFEYKDFHFGTMLGITISDFNYQLNTSTSSKNGISNIIIEQGPGMGIHIPVVSWNPHPVYNVRLVPSLSFHETAVTYQYVENDQQKSKTTRNERTLLNFPLLMKFNTRRLTNFSAYAITGLCYSYDLASQKDVDPKLNDPILRLREHEFSYQVGGGFDFYLPYFKFGIDIKLSNGINDLLIHDQTFFSDPLRSLRSQTWWFSITFEG